MKRSRPNARVLLALLLATACNAVLGIEKPVLDDGSSAQGGNAGLTASSGGSGGNALRGGSSGAGGRKAQAGASGDDADSGGELGAGDSANGGAQATIGGRGGNGGSSDPMSGGPGNGGTTSGGVSGTGAGGGGGAKGGASNGGSGNGGSGAKGGAGGGGASNGGAGASNGGTSAAAGTPGNAGTSSGGSAAGGAGGAGFNPCPTTGDCKILPLGESITFGIPGNNGGYRVKLFTDTLADNKHITFVGSLLSGPAMVSGVAFPRANEGHSGFKISELDAICTTTAALKDSPQIILLHIGVNDLSATAAGASDRLGALIDKLVAALPNSLVAVAAIVPCPSLVDAVATYNAAIPDLVTQRASAGKHVIFVDQFSGFPASALVDGVHPNDTVGYPRMGDVWYAAIKQYLH